MDGSNIWIWIGLGVIVVGALAYTQLGPPAAAAPEVASSSSPASDGSAATARALPPHREAVAQGAALIDVRTPGEFRAGHLDGAINIPLDELPRRLGELTPGQDAVIYCRTGRRSGLARPILERAGHRVHDIKTMGRW